MKRVILILFLVLLVPNGNLLMQKIPDCMCPPLSYPPTGQIINDDSSLVIDTCGIFDPSQNCDSAFWNNINSEYEQEARGRVYAKKLWNVYFDVDAIPLDSAGAGTLLYVKHYAIDSINYPDIKQGFRKLEEKYGNYRLRKIFPNITSGEDSRYFRLYFDNYVKYGEIIHTLDTMKHVICSFANWPKLHGTNIIDDKDIKADDLITIFPNPANEYIEITFLNHRVNPMVNNLGIEIYNVLGECVKKPIPTLKHTPNPSQEGNLRVDVSDLPNGIYFVRIGNIYQSFMKM